MTTVPIYVYKCWNCGRLYATDEANLEVECFGSKDDQHQVLMELALESSIEVTARE